MKKIMTKLITMGGVLIFALLITNYSNNNFWKEKTNSVKDTYFIFKNNNDFYAVSTIIPESSSYIAFPAKLKEENKTLEIDVAHYISTENPFSYMIENGVKPDIEIEDLEKKFKTVIYKNMKGYLYNIDGKEAFQPASFNSKRYEVLERNGNTIKIKETKKVNLSSKKQKQILNNKEFVKETVTLIVEY